jgi:MFS family permease
MSNSRLYFAASVACMTAALFGYSVGFIGGVLVLPSFLRHFNLFSLSPSESASTQARIVLVWLIGAFLGVPLGIPACSRLGRRMCLNLSAALYVVGAAMQLVDLDLPAGRALALFEVGRFVNGLGVGAGTLVSPM